MIGCGLSREVIQPVVPKTSIFIQVIQERERAIATYLGSLSAESPATSAWAEQQNHPEMMVVVWPLAPLQKKVANLWFGSFFKKFRNKDQANRSLTNFETLI